MFIESFLYKTLGEKWNLTRHFPVQNVPQLNMVDFLECHTKWSLLKIRKKNIIHKNGSNVKWSLKTMKECYFVLLLKSPTTMCMYCVMYAINYYTWLHNIKYKPHYNNFLIWKAKYTIHVAYTLPNREIVMMRFASWCIITSMIFTIFLYIWYLVFKRGVS